jgi:putative spermidine/putrescine transport system substrate-binding protein
MEENLIMKRRNLLALAASAFAATSLGATRSAWAADDPILHASWDEIVAQAKAEGEVVWYNWFLQPKLRELAAPFEQEYGIKVTIPDGTQNGNFDKFLADGARPTGDIDVMTFPGDTLDTFDPAATLLGPLDILPDAAKLRTKINGGDSKGFAVAYWGNQTGFAYDPDKIAEADLPQTWDEVSAYVQAHPLQFAFNDLRKGGAGNAFVQAVIRNTVSAADIEAHNFGPAWDWLNANKDNYGFTASNADSLTRLSGGEFTIVSAWEDHLASLQKSGEVDKRLKFYIPKFGMPGGGNVAGVAANAPHKAAAMVFISWLTSAQTQIALANEMGTAPVNADAVGQGNSTITAEQRGYAVEWFPAATLGNPIKAEYLEKVVLQ